jgi:hypothetical protein
MMLVMMVLISSSAAACQHVCHGAVVCGKLLKLVPNGSAGRHQTHCEDVMVMMMMLMLM